jgi:2'-5' RNA ligase
LIQIRSFVAARLPDPVREDLVRLQGRLRARGVEARWIAAGSIHLTFKFLGEIEAALFEAVAQALAAPLGVRGPLRLAVKGVGAFPSPKRARVVWAGLEGDVEPLTRLAVEVEARVERLGIARERRPFQPHLTLGRARNPSGVRGLEDALAAEGDFRGLAFDIADLTLYESRLQPRGPLYLPRLSIPLT